VFFLPWWLLLVGLVVSALASYLLLEHTQAGDSPWALYPLTAVLAPVVLAGTVFVGIALSTFLSVLLEDQSAEPPEGTGAETTLERTVPATTSTPPSTSPSSSPTASPTASPASSPTASPTASPSP
jgi:NhaP-type Na+/H+ or K+/H+ antiporter